MEASKPSKYWIETGSGALGKVFVEVLKCDNLPNLDVAVAGRNKTDAFACIVFEDSLVNTDVIRDSLSPRWMPWCQRAFVFNIMHPSSQLLVGLVDLDSGVTNLGHDFIGRAVVNLSNLRPQTLYTLTFVLYESRFEEREGRGTVTLRLRLDIPDAREALVAGAIPILSHDVSVAERDHFHFVRKTITQGVCSMLEFFVMFDGFLTICSFLILRNNPTT
jgi:C2 domain